MILSGEAGLGLIIWRNVSTDLHEKLIEESSIRRVKCPCKDHLAWRYIIEIWLGLRPMRSFASVSIITWAMNSKFQFTKGSSLVCIISLRSLKLNSSNSWEFERIIYFIYSVRSYIALLLTEIFILNLFIFKPEIFYNNKKNKTLSVHTSREAKLCYYNHPLWWNQESFNLSSSSFLVSYVIFLCACRLIFHRVILRF